MKITFLGALHQVTGSRTLIEWTEGRYLLVDCGMEQGINEFEQAEMTVLPSQIEYVFLTHAHIDHSGLIPLLYKQGFHGIIYSTAETMDLCSIMLADSAHIQETDAASETKKNQRTGGPVINPLYTLEDAVNVMKLFRPCEYKQIYMIDEGLSVRFTDAGHLLGSSFVEFFLEENGHSVKLVCSGDVGNYNQPIIRNPGTIEDADYLLIESTYGTRFHESVNDPVPYLADILKRTFERGGSVIIPSFAVGRTQELLYFFREIKQKQLIPPFNSFPVYVDSPLANQATAVFLQCNAECLNESTIQIMSSGQNPIWFDGLSTTVSSEESKALNSDPTPKVIIASGGMCEGGRIRHHLKHNLWDKKNTILFVGYQAVGTLGRIIYDGAKNVRIFGEPIDVNAEIALLSGVSGHADEKGLLDLIDRFSKKPEIIFVNHGDDDSCVGFSKIIQERFGIMATAPYAGSEFDLLAGEWIRLTEPVYRKAAGGNEIHSVPQKKKDTAFTDLQKAVSDLSAYSLTLAGHSNSELKELTERIRALFTGQD